MPVSPRAGSAPYARLDAGGVELVGEGLYAHELDAQEGRGLPDLPADPFGFDPDRPRDDVRVTPAQDLQMVDSVQQGDDVRFGDAIAWGELERSFQLHRLDRDPDGVDLALELRCGRHRHVERAENGALNLKASGVALERRRPHQEDGLCPRSRERRRDQAPTPPGPRTACLVTRAQVSPTTRQVA